MFAGGPSHKGSGPPTHDTGRSDLRLDGARGGFLPIRDNEAGEVRANTFFMAHARARAKAVSPTSRRLPVERGAGHELFVDPPPELREK